MRAHAHDVTALEAWGVPRPPSDTVQIAIRVPRDWMERADDLAKRISRPGVIMSRTDAFRAAIAAGFDALATTDESKPKPRSHKR
jgi:hypothetical protein